MKLYICYEPDFFGNENTVMTEEEWKRDFDSHGDHENFNDRDDWFTEMISMSILVPMI